MRRILICIPSFANSLLSFAAGGGFVCQGQGLGQGQSKGMVGKEEGQVTGYLTERNRL